MRGDGKGDPKGETQRGEKSAHHAVRHGVLFSLMGFPLRKKTLCGAQLRYVRGLSGRPLSVRKDDLPHSGKAFIFCAD